MNWIFLLIGLAIGLILGYMWMVWYLGRCLYGRMMTDRRDPEHFIFRLEFTKDPGELPQTQKYILLRVEETQLPSIKDDSQ